MMEPVTPAVVAAAPVVSAELLAVAGLLASIPVIAATVFALVDVIGRRDLTRSRKAVYAAGVVLVTPATLLYLLSRPTSIVRHRTQPVIGRSASDWRRGLVTVLETPEGNTPSMSSGEIRGMIDRIDTVVRSTEQNPGTATDPRGATHDS